MAIDTAAKRLSVLAVIGNTVFGVDIDGSIDGGDRLALCGLYRGIAAAAPPAVVDSGYLVYPLPDRYAIEALSDRYEIGPLPDRYKIEELS